MARTKPEKEPGRLKQMWQVFQMTRRYDPSIVWFLILAFLVPIGGLDRAVGRCCRATTSSASCCTSSPACSAGVLLGARSCSAVAPRTAAYSQIAGQPGAVGAVLKNGLRRSWIGSEMPVNVSPKTQDAVYRAVGTRRRRAHRRGPALAHPADARQGARQRRAHAAQRADQPALRRPGRRLGAAATRSPAALRKFKNKLTKAEVQQIDNRLTSLGKGRDSDPRRASTRSACAHRVRADPRR